MDFGTIYVLTHRTVLSHDERARIREEVREELANAKRMQKPAVLLLEDGMELRMMAVPRPSWFRRLFRFL